MLSVRFPVAVSFAASFLYFSKPLLVQPTQHTKRIMMLITRIPFFLLLLILLFVAAMTVSWPATCFAGTVPVLHCSLLSAATARGPILLIQYLLPPPLY